MATVRGVGMTPLFAISYGLFVVVVIIAHIENKEVGTNFLALVLLIAWLDLSQAIPKEKK